MAGVKFLGYTLLKSATENEIQKLFADYEKTLLTQKQKMCDDITQWRDALIHSIHGYVNKQKSLLEQEYANQMQYLNETSQQFITELRAHEQTYNTEQINRLLGLCKALKFELTALKHYGQTIPFLKVRSKESEAINQEEFYVVENKNDKFNNNSTVKDDNKTEDNTNQQPSTLKTSNNKDRSTIYRNEMHKECPTCFMTFPSNMARVDRHAHVNEHFKNN